MITPTFFISFSNFIRTVKRNRHDTRGHGGILSIRAPCIRTLPAEPAYAYGRTSAADACGTLRNDTQDFCPAAVRAVSYSGSVPSGTVFTPYKNNDFPRYCQTYRKILSTNFEHSRPVKGSVRFPARTPECGRTDGKNRATESLSPHNTRTVRGGRRRGQARLPAAQPERSRNAAEPCRPHRTGTGHPTGLCRPTFRNGILRNTSATDGTVRIRFGRMRTAGIRTTAPLPRAPRSSVPAAAIPDPPGKCPAQVEHVRPHRGAKSSGNIRLPPANPCRPEYACNSMHTSATPRRGETRKNVPPPQRQARIYLGRLSQ